GGQPRARPADRKTHGAAAAQVLAGRARRRRRDRARAGVMANPGRLVLIGTPPGNREGLSDRGRRSLLEADLLLCEDTRSPQRLLPEVALPERISCFVGNEHERVALLIDRLAAGQTVAFVSEAGLPV